MMNDELDMKTVLGTMVAMLAAILWLCMVSGCAISGTVRDAGGEPMEGIRVTATGSVGGRVLAMETATNESGEYGFTVIPTASMSVRPDSVVGFDPPIRRYVNIVANVTDANFVAILNMIVISGRVTNPTYSPPRGMVNVIVTATEEDSIGGPVPGGYTVTVRTGADGTYTLTVPQGWTGSTACSADEDTYTAPE